MVSKVIDMFGGSILLLGVMARLAAADDESSLVREREDALAKALNARDKVILSTLMDKDFSLHLTCGSAVRNFSTEVRREDWIDDLIHLRIDSYAAVISKVHLVRGSLASVTLDESWTVHSPRGSRIEKRFRTTDTWFKLQGTWKLTGRISAPYPRDCTDGPNWDGGPYLRFP